MSWSPRTLRALIGRSVLGPPTGVLGSTSPPAEPSAQVCGVGFPVHGVAAGFLLGMVFTPTRTVEWEVDCPWQTADALDGQGAPSNRRRAGAPGQFVDARHSRTVPSPEPDARVVPSGLMATLWTYFR
jgi:hypothetical protein